MPNHRVSETDHERIFGPREAMDAPGRWRFCKVCGGEHRLDRPWPHNCRSEAPPRAKLAAPMVTAPFEPFKTGAIDGEAITNRHEKAEYMKKHDLVEYETGVDHRNEWVEDIEHKRDIVQDFKRIEETDPLNLPPVESVDEKGSLDKGTEIETDSIEVIK